MTPDRLYYRYRKGTDPDRLTFEQAKRLLRSMYRDLDGRGWFQVHMGKDCVDAPEDVGAYVLEELGWDAWPLDDAIEGASEDELFTILEFLYDNVSEPTDSSDHPYAGCGLHVRSGDDLRGRAELRERVNRIIERYEVPHTLRENGEVWESAPLGIDAQEPVSTEDPSIDDRVRAAQSAFRRHGATLDDKRHAVRDLADVLELLRSTIGTNLPSADENRLFEIANQFGIRHHNPAQKTDYDAELWLDYMYYAYLNAIATASRILARSEETT